jgi:protein-L-isoaspartate(D-aspartate) O-methyltransferase
MKNPEGQMLEKKDSDYYQSLRDEMVEHQLKARGICEKRVLEAMRRVPRHLFVPPVRRDRAYDDTPLPLGEGQTISQPYMVAWMTELLGLEGDETILEVGTGSGYQAAILGVLAKKVYTIERLPMLADAARRLLAELSLDNVEVVVGDGSKGLEEHVPYDGILVTAGSPSVPQVLVEQLADGGRLVIPVGPASMQVLTVITRHGSEVETREMGSCVFVPLVGIYGWEKC